MIHLLLLILVVFAILSVELKNLYHSILCLTLVGIILGLIFFALNANLIGIFQIAVYSGMSMVLLYLIVMLGEKYE